MTSREPLWDQFGQAWGWPLEDLTLEQDLIDLAWHQPEPNGARHLPMRSCAQTSACSSAASTPSPPTSKGVDAAAALWVLAADLDQVLYATVRMACRVLAVHEGCLAWPGSTLGGVRRPARPVADEQSAC